MSKITSFSGPFAFLSNFSICIPKIEYDGQFYDTVEAAYQAAKTFDTQQRLNIKNAKTPGIAKKLGQKVTIRNDWENIKYNIMYDLVSQKFSDIQGVNVECLIELTRDRELIEGNWWGDTYWGVCNGKGDNNLGKILMEIREKLKPIYYASLKKEEE